MSHKPERHERDCLNCETIVYGRFCHICGQENVVPKETFWSLLKHFIEDLTHFDNKFFESLQYILFRPGFISRQYMLGKRASFLNPIRMYLFTSAIFFLIFFSLKNPVKITDTSESDLNLNSKQRIELIKVYEKELQNNAADTAYNRKIRLLKDTLQKVSYLDLAGDKSSFNFSGKKYKSPKGYDSIQRTLPAAKRDNWFERKWIAKELEVDQKYKGDTKQVVRDFGNAILHRLPYLLFVSLPFFALLLELLYVRRKQFFYADHIIFTFHHYIFSFILLLAVIGLDALEEGLHWRIFKYAIFILLLIWPAYLLIALKNFYNQGWSKTFIKFLLLNFLGFIVIMILFSLFAFLSIFQL